jgi:hypothetical protein
VQNDALGIDMGLGLQKGQGGHDCLLGARAAEIGRAVRGTKSRLGYGRRRDVQAGTKTVQHAAIDGFLCADATPALIAVDK